MQDFASFEPKLNDIGARRVSLSIGLVLRSEPRLNDIGTRLSLSYEYFALGSEPRLNDIGKDKSCIRL